MSELNITEHRELKRLGRVLSNFAREQSGDSGFCITHAEASVLAAVLEKLAAAGDKELESRVVKILDRTLRDNLRELAQHIFDSEMVRLSFDAWNGKLIWQVDTCFCGGDPHYWESLGTEDLCEVIRACGVVETELTKTKGLNHD